MSKKLLLPLCVFILFLSCKKKYDDTILTYLEDRDRIIDEEIQSGFRDNTTILNISLRDDEKTYQKKIESLIRSGELTRDSGDHVIYTLMIDGLGELGFIVSPEIFFDRLFKLTLHLHKYNNQLFYIDEEGNLLTSETTEIEQQIANIYNSIRDHYISIYPEMTFIDTSPLGIISVYYSLLVRGNKRIRIDRIIGLPFIQIAYEDIILTKELDEYEKKIITE